MNLQEKVANPRGSKSVSDYFQLICSIADDLAIIISQVTRGDLVIDALNGISPKFNELAAGIRASESKISFEDLLDKMTDFESFLRKQDMLADSIIPSTNYVAKNNKATVKSQVARQLDHK